MSIPLLTFYILVWPVLAVLVMIVLCVALVRDIRAARKKGTTLV